MKHFTRVRQRKKNKNLLYETKGGNYGYKNRKIKG